MNAYRNRRVLLIDDMPSIHEDFRKTLVGSAPATGLAAAEAALFGDTLPAEVPRFELASAYQGQEGLAMLSAALGRGLPYAMAFVDMRMPPGWDGVETILRLWQVDPRLQVVICTAYSDYSWEEVLERLEVRDRLLILKKPFDNIEVCQLANALCAKWEMTEQAAVQMHRLEEAVQDRTLELRAANAAREREMREREALQTRLMQSEKLASIGQLAAGVAHEINNPIGFVLSNLRTLDRYVADLFSLVSALSDPTGGAESPGRGDLARVRGRVDLEYLREDAPQLLRESFDGCERVQRIVQDLRDFSHIDSEHDWQEADVEEALERTLRIAGSQIGPRTAIVRAFGNVPATVCLPSRLNQVLLNLLVNAGQAVQGTGTIWLRTGATDAETWIEVADDGVGIAPEHLDRIFDPFFTTKPVGQGTGLGLALSYGIVRDHGGRIDVDSVPGQGATFRVTLPRHGRAGSAGGTGIARPETGSDPSVVREATPCAQS